MAIFKVVKWWALLFAVLIFSNISSATEKTKANDANIKNFPDILSYYDLLRLSDNNRSLYISKFAQILEVQEGIEKENYFVTQNNFEQREEVAPYAAVWSLIFPQASASFCGKLSCPAGMLPGLQGILWGMQCVSLCPAGTGKGYYSCPNWDQLSCISNCAEICDSSVVTSNPAESKEKEEVIKEASLGSISDSSLRQTDNAPTTYNDHTPTAANLPDKQSTNAGCQPIQCPKEDPTYRFKKKKEFEARVRETKDLGCINGGLISAYAIDGNKKCKPVQHYKIGKLKLSCAKNETMCSPILFGLQSDTPAKPFCVRIGLEMTESCMKKAHGTAGAKRFWKRADLTHEDLSDEWDKVRNHLGANLCQEPRSAEYHCKECAIIAKQLVNLNKLTDSCSNTCGLQVGCFASGVKTFTHGDHGGQ